MANESKSPKAARSTASFGTTRSSPSRKRKERRKRIAAYEDSLHAGDALVRPIGAAALHRVLLVGGKGAMLLAPPLLAIAAEHGCAVTVYTLPDWLTALAKLVLEHKPDVVMVESAAPPPRCTPRCIWLQPRGASTPLEYALWAAQAWRTAANVQG